MNDDELLATLRAATDAHIADRIESLLAEVAGLRAERGRVPVSWDECADWLDAGGVVMAPDHLPTMRTAASFRKCPPVLPLSSYRLLPPPGLVAAPSGMDGGGFLGAGADVPDGWDHRVVPLSDEPWRTDRLITAFHGIVQCRPPVKPAARKVVEVPLTQLVGHTVEGCDWCGAEVASILRSGGR